MASQLELQLGEARESWCAVELDKSQSWCRKEMKHYKKHFESIVFDRTRRCTIEERCTWKPDVKTHREKRHFAYTHQKQLVI